MSERPTERFAAELLRRLRSLPESEALPLLVAELAKPPSRCLPAGYEPLGTTAERLRVKTGDRVALWRDGVVAEATVRHVPWQDVGGSRLVALVGVPEGVRLDCVVGRRRT